MEILIQLIFIIAFLKYCIKATMNKGMFSILAYSVALGIVILLIYPSVITKPITIINDILNHKDNLSNLAVIISSEALFGVWISLTLTNNHLTAHSQISKQNKTLKILSIVPEGILIILGTAYSELLFIGNRVGSNFMWSAILFALITIAAVATLALIFRYSINTYDLKIKFNLTLNLILLASGLFLSSSIAGYNNPNSIISIEWNALAAVLLLASLLFATGIWLDKININHKLNNLISQTKTKLWNK